MTRRTLVESGGDTGLRNPRTSLVGREAELDAIGAALAGSRLVTVTGLGGTGKTRLALEAASRVGSARADGVGVVGLAPLGSTDEIVTAVLGRVDPRPGRGGSGLEPITQLIGELRPRDLLLVLDNCEHLLDEVAEVADRLLEGCPRLTLLATSREPLRIAGESVLAIDPLNVEPATPGAPSPAIQLFVERARAVRHDFSLDEGNFEDVLAICRLVDGIPLAIELAAAHVGHLSPMEIGRRLEEQPGSVAARDRTTAARHRTLSATLDWSYFLLDPQEQMVLRRLSLFVGGAPADGIAAVCDLTDHDVRDAVAGLVAKNLVLAEQRDGMTQYRLLDTVRRYALGRLEADGEIPEVRRLQAAWFLTHQEDTGDGASSRAAPDPGRIADLTACCNWLVEAGEADLAVELAAASWRTWELTGRHAEGRRLLAAVLAAADDPTLTRTRVLVAAAHLAFASGDLASARSQYEQGIDELRGCSAENELAAALNSLAMVHLYDGERASARALATEALEEFRRLDDAGGAAFAHTSLGMIGSQELRSEDAEHHFLDALQAFRRLGLKREAASVLDNLGNLAADLGHPVRAHRFYEGALQLQEQIGDDRGAALSLNGLCLVAQQRGNLDRAWEYAEAARQRFHRTGDRTGEAATINNLANLATERGQFPQALELYGECIHAFRQMGQARRLATALRNMADLARGVEERHLAWNCLIDATSLWNQLGETSSVRQAAADLLGLAETWGAAGLPELEPVAAGDEKDTMAVAHALESARWLPIPEPPRAAEGRAEEGPLTAREQQVVGLVGRGLTNAEIAAELFISERTVESHVSNARTKLGIDSRTKLTRWAVEQDLAG